MSPIVKAQMDAEVLKLSKVADTPTEPIGYGSDIGCVTDIDPDVTEVRGVRVLAESIARSWYTPRGSNPADLHHGIDLRGYLNRGVTATEVREIAGNAKNEAIKDDRVSSAEVTMTPSPTGSEIKIEAVVTPVGESRGPFRLITIVTDAGAIIREIRADERNI